MLRALGFVTILGLCFIANAAWADQEGVFTPSEKDAQMLVMKAVDAYIASGDDAFADMTGPGNEYHRGPLYIFVIGRDELVLAQSADPNRIGFDNRLSIDADGVAMSPLLRKIATPEGAWVHYRWAHPITQKLTPKKSWIVLHDGLIFGAGVYLKP
ncbi:MAG: hypothetical protein GKR97_03300 [Rhizobiaceae bacterium]|nr:hypothetical protein [Rhizobiaceae bacterium]